VLPLILARRASRIPAIRRWIGMDCKSVVAPMAAVAPLLMLVVPRPKEDAVDETAHAAEVGDLIVIAGHYVGQAERVGEILEVLGELPHESYRVRWDDGHESVFRPGSDATIKHHTRRQASPEEM
jgi:Domain of unknown function (DUF1918)